MEELKKCPFCGGFGYLHESYKSFLTKYRIRCVKCGTETDCYFSRKKAIKEWNKIGEWKE